MARGKNAKDGSRRVSANGYDYTKTEDRGWVLTHWLVAEEKLGRKIQRGERVSFADGDRTNFAPDNIKVTQMGGGSLPRRKAQLEARIQELQAELEDVIAEIAGP